jgi:hypothetical protein
LHTQDAGKLLQSDSSSKFKKAWVALPAKLKVGNGLNLGALAMAADPERYITEGSFAMNTSKLEKDVEKLQWSVGAAEVMCRSHSPLHALMCVATGRFHKQHLPFSALKVRAVESPVWWGLTSPAATRTDSSCSVVLHRGYASNPCSGTTLAPLVWLHSWLNTHGSARGPFSGKTLP